MGKVSHAAGILFRTAEPRSRRVEPRYLLLERPDSLWGVPGGGVEYGDKGRLGTARRETVEEIGFFPHVMPDEDFRTRHQIEKVDRHGNVCSIYQLIEARVPEMFEPDLDHEHIGWAWVTLPEMIMGVFRHGPRKGEELELHPGLAASLTWIGGPAA